MDCVGLFLASRQGSLKAGIAPSSSMRIWAPRDPQSPSVLMRTCTATTDVSSPCRQITDLPLKCAELA